MLTKFSLGNVLDSKTQIANTENNSLYIQVTGNISLLQKVATAPQTGLAIETGYLYNYTFLWH